jgi:hypothetical protein
VTTPPGGRGYQHGQDLVLGLRIFGTGDEIAMSPLLASFTLGRTYPCELRDDNNEQLSRLHARVTRQIGKAYSLTVSDISSGKNRLVGDDGVAMDELHLGAGDSFRVGERRYLAVNAEMQLVRGQLSQLLGFDHRAIDSFLVAAIKDSSRRLILEGEKGQDQKRLVWSLHQVSYRRHAGCSDLEDATHLDSNTQQKIIDARSGTILVRLFQRGKLEQALVSALLASDARLIFAAERRGKVASSFTETELANALTITIPPLRIRALELPALLNGELATRESAARFERLPSALQTAIRRYAWPNNFEEFREFVDCISVAVRYGSRKQLMKVRNQRVTDGVIRTWEKRLDVRFPFPLLTP